MPTGGHHTGQDKVGGKFSGNPSWMTSSYPASNGPRWKVDLQIVSHDEFPFSNVAVVIVRSGARNIVSVYFNRDLVSPNLISRRQAL